MEYSIMTLQQLPDEPTITDFKQLDRVSLDAIPYEIKWWQCQGKGCKCGTRVRDYGLHPWYLLHRASKKAIKQPAEYWRKLDWNFWMCGKHHKAYERLIKTFSPSDVQNKLCDFDKPRVIECLPPN